MLTLNRTATFLMTHAIESVGSGVQTHRGVEIWVIKIRMASGAEHEYSVDTPDAAAGTVEAIFDAIRTGNDLTLE